MQDKQLNSLFNLYYSKCLAYARSYVFDKTEAEGIVNDAFCLLWQKSAERQQEIEPVPFLFATIRNKSLNYLRGKYREAKAMEGASSEGLREMEIRISNLESRDPHELYNSEIMQIMESTLRNLPAKTADIFRMSRSEGLSYTEIAQRAGIGMKAVEYHISMALRALRSSLKDYLP